MKKLLISILVLFILIVPVFSHSAGLVPCDNSSGQPCDFNQLMNLVNTIIRFILVNLAVPIAAIMFAYAGFKMVSSGGSAESRSKAKSIFSSTAIGLILVAVSWLIIRTLLSILGYQGAWIFASY